jgi:hypothetical protein
MEELVGLTGSDGENCGLFLALADANCPTLSEADRLKCLYLKARCHAGREGEGAKAAALWRAICKDHPDSRWAAESAFWLAERELEQGHFGRARQAYRAMAAKHPNSPRAPVARRWARWLGEVDETSRELGEVLGEAVRRLNHLQGGIAFAFRKRTAGDPKGLEGRFAWQDGRQLYLAFRYGDCGMILANNKDGGWYQALGEGVITRGRKGMELPVPCVEASGPPQNELKVWWGVSTDPEKCSKPSFQISPAAVAHLVSELKGRAHLHRQVRTGPDGRTTILYRLECAEWNDLRPWAVVVEADAGKRLRSVSLHYRDDGGHKSELTVSGIALGERLPEATFAVNVPPGVQIRETEELSTVQIVGNLFRLFGDLVNQLPRGCGTRSH